MVGQADKVFVLVAKAFEDENSLTGQAATRVVAATKALMGSAGVDPTPLLQQFSPESQRKITAVFS